MRPDDLDLAVRDALDDLAGKARPVNLAGPAVRQADRLRRRRTAGKFVAAAASVLFLAAGLTVVTQTAGHKPDGPIGSDASPSPSASAGPSVDPSAIPITPDRLGAGRFSLPGGWFLIGGPDGYGTFVYDRAVRAFRPVKAERAVPAPVGSLVAWFGPDGKPRVLDLTTDKEQRIDSRAHVNLPGRLEWSPTGTHFLYTTEGSGGGVVAVVVNAAARTFRTVHAPANCAAPCEAAWLPDGNQLTIGLRIFDGGTGQAAGNLKLPGPPATQHAWSPERNRVVVTTAASQPIVVDAATGQKIADSPCGSAYGTYWVDADQLLCVSPEAYTTYELTGRAVVRIPLPAPLVEDEVYATTLGRS